jgi:hypothetical protein
VAADEIKRQIDERLAALVSLPVSTAGRAVDMAMFGFGRLVEREGRRGLVGVAEFGLHIQETWRVTRLRRLLELRSDKPHFVVSARDLT